MVPIQAASATAAIEIYCAAITPPAEVATWHRSPRVVDVCLFSAEKSK
jgi:hypothetical protein